MVKPSKLIFVRHAPVELVEGCFPDNDPNAIINDTKIKNLASRLPKDCIWYVSPLKRTTQTAKALLKYVTAKEMIIEKKLKEQNFGDWSGQNISEIWQLLRTKKSQHNYSFICPEVSPPNGENFLTQLKRVSIWLEELNFFKPQTAVIITHSGTIKGVIAHALGVDPDKVIGIEISHLSLTSLEIFAKKEDKNRGGRFRILEINNRAE